MNHVLIATGRTKNGDSRIYHVPSEDNPDVPKCHSLRSSMTKEWVRKGLETLPTHRVCKDCSGESQPPEQPSTQVCTLLKDMDPDDVGGSA